MYSVNRLTRRILFARASKVGNVLESLKSSCVCQRKFLSSLQNEAQSGEAEHSDINYTVSSEDFEWVERLFPPSLIPQPPEHKSYPTPSGWVAPSNNIPDKPFFVRRSRYHTLPVYETRKPKNSNRWLTIVGSIEGDIWALEKELIELVQPTLDFDPATRVHELTQSIWIKGLHQETITNYLYDLGF